MKLHPSVHLHLILKSLFPFCSDHRTFVRVQAGKQRAAVQTLPGQGGTHQVPPCPMPTATGTKLPPHLLAELSLSPSLLLQPRECQATLSCWDTASPELFSLQAARKTSAQARRQGLGNIMNILGHLQLKAGWVRSGISGALWLLVSSSVITCHRHIL